MLYLLFCSYDILVVHAGLVPGVPLQQQDLASLIKMRELLQAADGRCGQQRIPVGSADRLSLLSNQSVYFSAASENCYSMSYASLTLCPSAGCWLNRHQPSTRPHHSLHVQVAHVLVETAQAGGMQVRQSQGAKHWGCCGWPHVVCDAAAASAAAAAAAVAAGKALRRGRKAVGRGQACGKVRRLAWQQAPQLDRLIQHVLSRVLTFQKHAHYMLTGSALCALRKSAFLKQLRCAVLNSAADRKGRRSFRRSWCACCPCCRRSSACVLWTRRQTPAAAVPVCHRSGHRMRVWRPPHSLHLAAAVRSPNTKTRIRASCTT